MKAEIKGTITNSLVDWPGNISFVIFLGGCNLRCPTCHNADIAWQPNTLPTISYEETKKTFLKHKTWYDGITITGGEPTVSDGLFELVGQLKRDIGLPIKLDTNGMKPDIVEKLLKANLVDAVAVDIKGPFSEYPELTGIKKMDFLGNLNRIFEMSQKYKNVFYFRTTKVPIVDNDKTLAKIKQMVPRGCKHYWQEYREVENMEDVREGVCM
jgi:pyruvate formate lyase activating enzyme